MADNNMESLLMGGDDSSSGESDDEVQVTGGTAASAVMPTPSPAPAPAAPTPAPAPMSHAARLKDLYNSQPKRTPGTSSSNPSTSTPAPATAPPPAAAPAPRPTPTMQPPPRQMSQPPSSAPNTSTHPSMQSMQPRPSHTSHPHQQHHPQSTQPPPQQHQQQPHRHVAPAPVYKPPTAAAPPPSQSQPAPRMQDPFAPTPLQHIKDRHQQKVEAQQRAQQQQMQMSHPSMQSQSRSQPTSHPPPSHQPHYSSQHPSQHPSQPPQQQRIPSAPAPAPPSYHHSSSQQPRQQPPPQAIQRMPQQQPPGQQPQDRAAMEREVRKQKEKFLMLTRVLIKYLEQKDAKLHHEAKMIIRDCNIRNKKGERGYESVTAAMKERLKALVGEQYWKRAEAYLKHFLDQKKQQIAQGTTSGRPAGAPVPPTAPSQPPQAQPPRMEHRKIEPPGGKSGKHPAATAPAAAAIAQGTSPILQQMQREIATQKAKVASQGKGASVGKKQPRRKSNTGPAAARKTVGAAAATPAAATPHVAAPVVTVDPNTLPPREYNELMKLVDHAIDYDWTTAGLLLGSKTDLQLTDEQQHLLYTSGKDSTGSASSGTDAWGQPKPSTGLRPGWGTKNVVSARTAWSLVRLREQNRSGVGDVGLTLPGSINGNSTTGGLNSNSNSNASTKEIADTSWLNDEKAEQDVVLAMLSEATEVYLKGILERAVGCARQRLNVNGIRLWHQQHVAGASTTPGVPPQTAAAASQGSKPALALRLGCDVTRQAALASGNAAMTVQRMEQALARHALPTRDRILQGETLETAQSMSDLSLRPQLAKGAENAELEGKRCFEVSGGKHAMEPPLGRVPKQAKLEVVDFQMGSHLVENVGRHWTSNAATSIYF